MYVTWEKQKHSPEINWEMEEVKMIRCSSLCSRVKTKREEKKKRERRVVTIEEEKIGEKKKRLKRTIEKLRKWFQRNS